MPTLSIRMREDGNLGLRFPYDPEMVARVKSFLARGYDRANREWWVPTTCAFDVVGFSTELAGLGWNIEGGELARELSVHGDLLADASRAKTLADIPSEFVLASGEVMSRLEPYDHQRAGVAWLTYALLHNGGALLADEMGLGKTKQIIDTVAHVIRNFQFGVRCVVVCPATLKLNWLREIRMNAGDVTAFVVEGTAAQRKKIEEQAARRTGFVIYNYETTWRSKNFESLCANAILVADEAHRLKNEKAKQTQAFADAAKVARGVILATGSPVVNASGDLYNLSSLIAPGLLGNTRYKFNDMFAVREAVVRRNGRPLLRNGRQVYTTTGYKNTEIIRDRVARVQLRRLKTDCLDLPEKTFNDISVELLPEQEQAYAELVQELRTTLRGVEPDKDEYAEETVDVHAAIALLIRLQQVADGFVSGGAGRAVFFDEGGAKFRALDDIVEDVVRNNGNKLVVWSRFTAPIKFALQRYADLNPVAIWGGVKKTEREAIVRSFQDGDARIFIGQIHTAGVGINLFRAQDEVFLSRWWSPAINNQAIDRLHRIGQTGTVTVNSLVAVASQRLRDQLQAPELRTIDEVVAATLAGKVALADELTGDKNEPTLADIFSAAGVLLEGVRYATD